MKWYIIFHHLQYFHFTYTFLYKNHHSSNNLPGYYIIIQFVIKHLLNVALSLGNLNYEEVIKDILLVASLVWHRNIRYYLKVRYFKVDENYIVLCYLVLNKCNFNVATWYDMHEGKFLVKHEVDKRLKIGIILTKVNED